MRKLSLFCLIAAACACLCLAVGCGGGNKSDGVTAKIVCEKELKFKVGEATDENILKTAKVELSDGKDAKPTLNKKGATLDKAGRYDVAYEYNQTSVNGVIWVYGAPQLYYNGEVLTEDTVTLTYAQAAQSFDFVKGIAIKDSFDNELTVSRTGDEFKNKAGEYTVTYSAKDDAGNECQRQIKYIVVGGDEPSVSDYTYVISMNDCLVPWDLKNNTRITAYMDGEIVNPENFVLTKAGLKFNTDYILAVGTGEKTVVIETENGNAEFKLTIKDEGNPVFAFEVSDEYIYGGVKIAEPERLITSHGDYEYTYSVTGADNKEYYAKIENGVVTFVDENDDAINKGDYTVTVTCDYNGKTAIATRSFSVVYAAVSGGESVTLTKEKFAEPLGGVTEAYKFIKPAGSSAWNGRLFYDAPLGAYGMVSVDLYLSSSSKADDSGKANATLSVCVDEDYRRITSVVDKESGEEIAEEDILLNKWYTVTFYAYTEKSGVLYIYFSPYNDDSVACEGYITGEKFVAVKGLTAVAFVKNPGSKCGLKQTIENGEMVISYSSNGSEWDSRLQFSEKMLKDYNDYFANKEDPKLNFSLCFVDEVKNIQFWDITEKGFGSCPTLGGLIESGVATMKKGGVKVTLGSAVAGEWYEVSVDIKALGVLALKTPDCGLQMGSKGAFKYKNVTLSAKKIINSGKTEVVGDDNCKKWQF